MMANLGIHDFPLFLIASTLLVLTPGPDTFLIVTRASTLGARAGLVTTAGIISGCFVHIIAATVGLSAILAASALAFTAIKWAGAAYLIWIGIALLRSKAGDGAIPEEAGQSAVSGDTAARLPMRALFVQGFLSNALNPKVIVFFIAFIPQFVSPTASDSAVGFLLLGLVFNAISLVWNTCTALTAARFRVWLKRPGTSLWINRIGGACFLGFGLKLALTERA